MKYYFDTEFIEGAQPKKFLGYTYGWTKPTIDLISVGIVREDGKSLELLSKDFNLDWAWKDKWIVDNVLVKLYRSLPSSTKVQLDFNKATMRWIMDVYGKSNKEIAKKIGEFVGKDNSPEFYAYYADYDWVVFCQLFGKMIDLPKNFPYYCRDLKQMLDSAVMERHAVENWHSKGVGLTAYFEMLKKHKDYPIETNEHSALADAQWNVRLHEFIIKLQQGQIKFY